jgi:hypothetical protein
MNRKSILWACLIATLILPGWLEARVTRIEITRVESPTFEGRVFGSSGQYEKLVGRAFGEVDRADPRNAVITDIGLAPTNASGKVEYSTDIYILKPINMARGNGKLFYHVLNRGNKQAISNFNDPPADANANDPTSANDVGNGFLMRKGYTLVWSGSESNLAENGRPLLPVGNRMLADFPVAKNPDGSSITGRYLDEIIFNNFTTTTVTLTYAAATTDQALDSLTVRQRETDPRVAVPPSEWSYLSSRQIRINRFGSFLSAFDAGSIYEFVYTAQDPIVMGLGHAATRDVASFFRYASADETGQDNPLAPQVTGVPITSALAFGSSQAGRYLKDFIRLGFNEDEAGRMVFDGVIPHKSGARGMILNFRFATPGPISWQHQNHHARATEFPFSYGVLFDPVSGRTDGVLERCLASGTCPKLFETASANEYWAAGGSLVVTDSFGNDITLPSNVRVYLFASTQHGPAAVPSFGMCQQLSNPNPFSPHLRALLVALDEWVTEGVAPPPSQHPRVSDGTLVSPLPQAVQGFPAITGVTYNGLINHVALLDFSMLPPVHVPGVPLYTVLVPKVDADGNDIAGIRSTTLGVPLGTYTGWNLRRAGFAEGEQCDLTGSFIPFVATKQKRVASDDPRVSIEERYRDHGGYVSRVADAADELRRARFLLQEDVARIIEEAAQSDVLRQ